MCYKATTYCPYYLKCIDGDQCPRALTAEVISEADKISVPIARFDSTPECFENKEVFDV
jgi:hypothetical protein